MQFERVTELVNTTPTGILCEAWSASPEHVELRKSAVHQMTVEEAGDLAALHGLKLPDILAV